MNKNFWDKVQFQMEFTFYTSSLVIICLLVSLFFSCLYFRRTKLNYLITLYLLAGALLFTFTDIIIHVYDFSSKINRTIFFEGLNVLFETAEFAFFYNFFQSILKSQRTRFLLKIFLIVFSGLIINFILSSFFSNPLLNIIRSHSTYVSSVSFLVILIGSLTYFYEILNDNSTLNLLRRPTFWISTGSLFYAAYSLPVFFIIEIFRDRKTGIFNYLAAGHYILLSLFCVTLIISFRCKKALTI